MEESTFTPLPLQVLFEDHHLLVVNKPAPLLTQAPPGVPSLEGLAKEYIKAQYAKPAGVYLGIPHRLDRPVSGVVCFARNTKAAQRIHSQFQEHRVKKVYWALVEGEVQPDADTWEDWVRKLPEESRVVHATEGEAGAKLAILGYRVLKRLEGTTLLELTPLTGRMHQLRVQSAWRGHPVLGDVAYGSTRSFGPQSELPRDRVIALHARSLTLSHPFTKEELNWVAAAPAYWGSDSLPFPPCRPCYYQANARQLPVSSGEQVMDLFVGTSSYSEKAWKGKFYPKDLPAAQMLHYYGEHFRAVEINTTFYAMPKVSVLERWAGQVAASFRFALKAPKLITHLQWLQGKGQLLSTLLDVVETLRERLGPLLFQLPPTAEKDMPRLRAFLGLLPTRQRAAFEFRHPSWFDDDVFGLLRDHRVALCVADTDDDLEVPFVATTDWGYLRLRRLDYDDVALTRWWQRIQNQGWREAFVFFKHEETAVGTRLAQRLIDLAD